MKFCDNCGTQLEENATVCANCGEQTAQPAECAEAVNNEVPDVNEYPQSENTEQVESAQQQPEDTNDVEEQAAEKPFEQQPGETERNSVDPLRISKRRVAAEAVAQPADIEEIATEQPKTPRKPRRRLTKKALGALIAICLLIVIIAAAVIAGVAAFGKSGNQRDVYYYTSNGSVGVVDGKSALDFAEEWNSFYFSSESSLIKSGADRTNIYYLDDPKPVSEEQGTEAPIYTTKYDLYYCPEVSQLGNDNDRVARDVVAFDINTSGESVAYINADGELFLGNYSDVRKIDSNVVEFKISANGKNLIYKTDDGDLYVKNGSKDSGRAGQDVAGLQPGDSFVSYGYENQKYYKYANVLADKDYKKVIYIDLRGDIYLKSGDKERKILVSAARSLCCAKDNLSEFLYIDSAGILNIQKGDNHPRKLSPDGHTCTAEAIFEDGTMFFAVTNVYGESDLWFYDGKTAECIEENCSTVNILPVRSYYDADKNTLAYFYNSEDGYVLGVRGSENVTAMPGAVWDILWYNEKVNTIAFSDAGTEMIGSFDYADNVCGEVGEVDNSYGAVRMLDNGTFMVAKNYKDGFSGIKLSDVYVSGELVAENCVVAKTGYNLIASYKNTAYYIKDYDALLQSGTLCSNTNGKEKEIASDVSHFVVADDGTVYFVGDWDAERGEGTLYSRKNKNIRIKYNVSNIALY